MNRYDFNALINVLRPGQTLRYRYPHHPDTHGAEHMVNGEVLESQPWKNRWVIRWDDDPSITVYDRDSLLDDCFDRTNTQTIYFDGVAPTPDDLEART